MSIETTGTLDRTTSDREAARVFLGWRMVGVAFLAQLLANGVTISAFSNFLKPVSESFGVGRGTVALGVPIAIASMGLAGPFVGRLVDRGYVRIVMTSGALLCGSGLILLSRVEELRTASFVFAAFVCIGAALCGVMPSMTMVANWFVKRRGFALGICFAGATVASYVAPASAQYMIDHGDWRTAVLCFGTILLTIGAPVFGLLAVGRPEDVGQLPDGEEPSANPTPIGIILSPQQLARDPRLWLLAIGFGLVMTSPVVLMTLLIPFGEGLGFTGQQATLFLAAMLPFSLFGKLAFGALADRAPAKPIIAFVVAMNLCVWVIFYSEPSYPLYLASGVLYGLGIGGVAPLQGVVMGRVFGRLNFGTASGMGGVPSILLLVVASTMSSLLQGDAGEGYPTIFVVQSCLLMLGGMLLAIVRIPAAADGVA